MGSSFQGPKGDKVSECPVWFLCMVLSLEGTWDSFQDCRICSALPRNEMRPIAEPSDLLEQGPVNTHSSQIRVQRVKFNLPPSSIYETQPWERPL